MERKNPLSIGGEKIAAFDIDQGKTRNIRKTSTRFSFNNIFLAPRVETGSV